jgi:hypothetical protein
MYKVVVLSILLQPGFILPFHEGEGNFELYLDIINGVGGLQGIVLSLLWAIGGSYLTKSMKYLIPYLAFASLTHAFLTKGNISVFITDLGLTLFLYSIIIWMKAKFQIKTSGVTY